MMNEVKETWNALMIAKLMLQADKAWEREDFPKAIKAYTKLIELDCHSDEKLSQYYEFRGDVYKEIKEYKNALLDYSDAIEINPLNDRAYARQGVIYYILDDEDEAYKSASASLLINEDNEIAQELIEIIEELE